MLSIGTKVKNFSLKDSLGNTRHLNEFKSQHTVIYFYPKNHTDACTRQACAFRDLYDVYQNKKIQVIGISKDSPKSHQAFIDDFHLPFILLSDETLEVIKYFGVWVEKSMYGRKYMGIQRSTFILDKKGIITHVFEKASPKENAKDIIKVLK